MNPKDSCEIYCYNEETVERIQNKIESEDISSMAETFKVLADENRVKVAFALSQGEELCVCDVANIIGSSVATASHHLRTLKKMGLVNYRREGKLAFYSLNNNHIKQLLFLTSTYQKEVISSGR